MLEFSAGGYTASRLQLEPTARTPEAVAHAAWKSHMLLSKLAAHKHFFTDYSRGCDGECKGFCRDLVPGCRIVKHRVASALVAKDAILWEVTKQQEDNIDFVGILRLSEVEPGCTAKAHYMFFDHSLKDKTELLQAWKKWTSDNLKLRRVTVEIPVNAFILAKHAVKHLGFGGDYEYHGLPVEGVLRGAKVLDNQELDVMILGCKL